MKLEVRERKKTSKIGQKPEEWYYYLGSIGQIGFTISLPIVLGAFAGNYLDRKYGLFPKATIGLIFAGIVISFFGFIKQVLNLTRRD